MEYKLTFEDGSEAYLAHYGVKGMKWRKHKAQQEEEDFNAEDYGMIDNSVASRRAARGEAFGNLAAKGKMSRERALQLAGNNQKDRQLAKTFRTRAQLNASRKRKNAYMAETRANKAEYAGDPAGLKRAQKRTDAFYGRRGGSEGKRAQATEAQRRRRSSDRTEAAMRKLGMKRSSDGVWRKG